VWRSSDPGSASRLPPRRRISEQAQHDEDDHRTDNLVLRRTGSPQRTGTSHAPSLRVQHLRPRDEARVDDGHALGTVDLMSGIVEDARDLVGAHVEALRDDMSARLATLGATLASMVIAIGVFVVTAVLLSLAVAASLVAIGTPWWIALWIVTLVAGAIGVGFVMRARAKARPTT
jgi:hypothetical protein